MKNVLLFVICLLSIFSCTGKQKMLSNVSREKLWEQVNSVTTDVEIVVTTHEEDRVTCVPYGPHCLSAFRLRVGLVKMILLQFTDGQTASDQAVKLNQFSYRNWVFDEVRGEPYLEKLLHKIFGAELNQVYAEPENSGGSTSP